MIWLLLQLLRLRIWRSCGWLGVSWLRIWGLVCIAVRCRKLRLVFLKWCLKVSDLGVELLALKCKDIRRLDLYYLQVIWGRFSVWFLRNMKERKIQRLLVELLFVFTSFTNWSLLKLLSGQYMLLMLFCYVTVVFLLPIWCHNVSFDLDLSIDKNLIVSNVIFCHLGLKLKFGFLMIRTLLLFPDALFLFRALIKSMIGKILILVGQYLMVSIPEKLSQKIQELGYAPW